MCVFSCIFCSIATPTNGKWKKYKKIWSVLLFKEINLWTPDPAPFQILWGVAQVLHTVLVSWTLCSSFQLTKMGAHSWFTLVINTLIALMDIGFQVTISKSEGHMNSNLFSWSKTGQLWIYFFSGCGGHILAFIKSQIIRIWFARHCTGESPRDPCHNQLCMCN